MKKILFRFSARFLPACLLCLALLLPACMGVILAMEFALEKKILFLQWMRMDLCCLVMAFASLGLILICAWVWRRTFGPGTASVSSPG